SKKNFWESVRSKKIRRSAKKLSDRKNSAVPRGLGRQIFASEGPMAPTGRGQIPGRADTSDTSDTFSPTVFPFFSRQSFTTPLYQFFLRSLPAVLARITNYSTVRRKVSEVSEVSVLTRVIPYPVFQVYVF